MLDTHLVFTPPLRFFGMDGRVASTSTVKPPSRKSPEPGPRSDDSKGTSDSLKKRTNKAKRTPTSLKKIPGVIRSHCSRWGVLGVCTRPRSWDFTTGRRAKCESLFSRVLHVLESRFCLRSIVTHHSRQLVEQWSAVPCFE